MTKKFNVATTMAELESANILISYSGFMSDQSLEGVSQGIKSIFETGSLKTRKSRKVFSVFVESAGVRGGQLLLGAVYTPTGCPPGIFGPQSLHYGCDERNCGALLTVAYWS